MQHTISRVPLFNSVLQDGVLPAERETTRLDAACCSSVLLPSSGSVLTWPLGLASGCSFLTWGTLSGVSVERHS